ncbi:MAG: hypothetical protein ABH810_01715 [bacterium]
MKRKIISIIFLIGILIALSFLIFKLTRPAVLMLNFYEPFDEKSVTDMLKGYEIKTASSNPIFGSVFVATEVRTNNLRALTFLNKLRKEPSYKEGKIQLLVVDLAMKSDKPVYRFYDRYADKLLEQIVNLLVR